jgi:hypothetical protein
MTAMDILINNLFRLSSSQSYRLFSGRDMGADEMKSETEAESAVSLRTLSFEQEERQDWKDIADVILDSGPYEEERGCP